MLVSTYSQRNKSDWALVHTHVILAFCGIFVAVCFYMRFRDGSYTIFHTATMIFQYQIRYAVRALPNFANSVVPESRVNAVKFTTLPCWIMLEQTQSAKNEY